MIKRLLAGSLIVAATSLQAVSITHFGDGPFSDVPSLLDDVGIGSGSVSSETTATSFVVPGPASTTTDLTFEFVRDTGSFLFEFGFFAASAVAGLDPVTDNAAYVSAALAAKTVVFDDVVDDVGDTMTVSVAAGTELGFYLIPDAGEAFGDLPENKVPLFSDFSANPGEFDQLLSFVGSGVTLFTWEDLRLDGGSSFGSGPVVSDMDFTDLAFTIDAELGTVTGVPDGGQTAFLLILSVALLAFTARAARRKPAQS